MKAMGVAQVMQAGIHFDSLAQTFNVLMFGFENRLVSYTQVLGFSTHGYLRSNTVTLWLPCSFFESDRELSAVPKP